MNGSRKHHNVTAHRVRSCTANPGHYGDELVGPASWSHHHLWPRSRESKAASPLIDPRSLVQLAIWALSGYLPCSVVRGKTVCCRLGPCERLCLGRSPAALPTSGFSTPVGEAPIRYSTRSIATPTNLFLEASKNSKSRVLRDARAADSSIR